MIYLSIITVVVLILNDDSLQDPFDDEVVGYLRATAVGDKRAAPFDWCKSTETRYPNIAAVTQDTPSIQASFVASEELFLIAGNIVDANNTKLSDESIRSSLLVRAWSKLLLSLKSN